MMTQDYLVAVAFCCGMMGLFHSLDETGVVNGVLFALICLSCAAAMIVSGALA